MTLQDLYLLSPEIALGSLAVLIVLLDLFITRKNILPVVAVVGLTIPAGLTLLLRGDLQSCQESTLTYPLENLCIGGGLQGMFNTLVVDEFAIFFKFLTFGVVALVILASTDYHEKIEGFKGEFYALILFSASGMSLLAATTELVSIYVSLELTTLPLVALVAFLRDERSSEAGMKFLILSALSSAVLLYGMTLVFGFTGSTTLAGIASTITRSSVPFGSYALLMGIVLMVAGFGFKISMVPFQMWVPDVYEGAPTPITAYLSVASKAAGFAVLLRVFYLAFGELNMDWGELFAVLSVISMVVGNLAAIVQSNVKRMLAYSTVAQGGYVLVGLAAVPSLVSGDHILGPSSVLFYLSGYAVTNLAAFFSVIVISNMTGSNQIDTFAGMGRRAPVIAGAFTIALVSLIGIPPTAGFIGKLYLFNAAVQSDLAWLAVVGMVNSVVSAYYYLRIVRIMYLVPIEDKERVPSSMPMRLSLGIATLGILAIGILPGWLLKLAQGAVLPLLSSS